MTNVLKILWCNILKVVTIKDLYCIIAINIIIFFVNFNSIDFDIYGYINNLFIKPSTIVEILTYSIHKFYLLYIIAKFIEMEFCKNNIYNYLRNENKNRYFIILSITALFIFIGYYIIGSFIAFLISNIFIKTNNVIKLEYYLILISKSVCIEYFKFIIYILSYFIMNNNMASFMINIILTYILSIIFNVFFEFNDIFCVGLFIIIFLSYIFTLKYFKKIDIYDYLK